MKKSFNNSDENLKDPPRDDSTSSSSEVDTKMSSNGVQGNARSGSQIMEQSGTNKDTKSTRKQQPLSLEDMVDILAKDPDLISMVEVRFRIS